MSSAAQPEASSEPLRPNAVRASSRVPVLRAIKRLAALLPLPRQAVLVRRWVPRRHWYRAALLLSRLHGAVIARLGGNGPFTTAMMFTFWLRQLSFGGPFPIPYRVSGLEVLLAPGPKVYTWTHLPLEQVPLRVGLQEGCVPPTVVADPGNIVGDSDLLVTGWPDRMQAIATDERLLRRVFATLKAGTPVVFLADPYLGGPLSDVPLRTAARLKVPLVFQWAELGPDGILDVVFRYAPRPYSETEDALQENLAFLRDRNRVSLAKFGWTPPA